MKNVLLSLSFAAVASVAWSVPSVSVVSCTQDAVTRRVTVEYVLSGGPAVVTAEFTTNGVALPAEKVVTLSGDVNVLVAARTEKYSFTWNPDPDIVARFGADEKFNVRLTPWDANDPPPYLVVDLCAPKTFFFYASSNAVPEGVQSDRYRTDMMVFVKIPACNRRFLMGSYPGEKGSRLSDFGETNAEVPHFVTLTNDYYMGIYEVTQKQFKRFFNSGSGVFGYLPDAALHPCENIVYETIRGSTDKGINWPSTGTNVTATSAIGMFRSRTGIQSADLPTEAEWEFACRAGTRTALNNGKELNYSDVWAASSPDDCSNLSEVGWWYGNAPTFTKEDGTTVKTTSVVGKKPCNAFGLYDMHGNVSEWCLDWHSYGDYYSKSEDVVAPVGPVTYETYAKRVLRGGSWAEYSPMARSAARGRFATWDYTDGGRRGFRIRCYPYFGK